MGAPRRESTAYSCKLLTFVESVYRRQQFIFTVTPLAKTDARSLAAT